MKLAADTTLENFREEMQHRVVKYPLNSRPVKEALRFAKKHEDPAFYRIASDKIHAQRQFQRELYGPTKLERLVDFFTLGSLREVVVTLLLVSVGVVGLDVTKRTLSPDPVDDLYADTDIEKLATRLGIAFETSRVANTAMSSESKRRPQQRDVNRKEANFGDAAGRLSDADVARIAEAVMQRLGQSPVTAKGTQESPETATLSRVSPETITATNDSPEPATEVRDSPEPAIVTRVSPETITVTNDSPESAIVTRVPPETITVTNDSPVAATEIRESPETTAMTTEEDTQSAGAEQTTSLAALSDEIDRD